MKKEVTYCDICGDKSDCSTLRTPFIFHTEQTEGRPCKPYITIEKCDICPKCMDMMVRGNFPHGSGAQGCNRYWFENEQEIKSLRHFRDTTLGLWATDRPDLLTDEQKKEFHLFKIK